MRSGSMTPQLERTMENCFSKNGWCGGARPGLGLPPFRGTPSRLWLGAMAAAGLVFAAFEGTHDRLGLGRGDLFVDFVLRVHGHERALAAEAHATDPADFHFAGEPGV